MYSSGSIGCDDVSRPGIQTGSSSTGNSAANKRQDIKETEFEKKRGISKIEIRDGFAQVHISQLSEPATEKRLNALASVRDAGISIDFLKLTPTGLAFLIPESLSEKVSLALKQLDVRFSMHEGRSIVLVHAVNMRDEEGLIARIVSIAIGSGANIDHLGDMHDRLMIATSADGAKIIAKAINDQIVEADA